MLKRLLFTVTFCSLPLSASAQDNAAPGDQTPVAISAPKAGLTGAFDWKLRLQPGQKWEIRTYSRTTQTNDAAPDAGTLTSATAQTSPLDGAPPAPPALLPPPVPESVPPSVLKPGSKMSIPPFPVPIAPSAPQHLEMLIIQRATFDYEVLAIDKFGASTVKLSCRELLFDTTTTADGQPYPDKKDAHRQLLVTGIKDASLTVKQAADGTVWNVSGADTLQGNIIKTASRLPVEQKSQAESLTLQLASDKYWRRFFQSLSGALPKYPVIVSESWSYDTSTPSDLPYQLSYLGKRTLKTRKAGVASIQEEAAIDSAISEAQPTIDPAAVRNYKGTIAGTSQIQEATGLPQTSNSSYRISGVVEADMPTLGGGSQKMNTIFNVVGETHLVMERKN